MAGALMVVMGFRDLFNYSVFFFSPEFLATDLSERASDVRLSGQSGPLPTSVPCLRQRLFAAAKAEGPHRSRTRRQRFRTLRYVVQTRRERRRRSIFRFFDSSCSLPHSLVCSSHMEMMTLVEHSPLHLFLTLHHSSLLPPPRSTARSWPGSRSIKRSPSLAH